MNDYRRYIVRCIDNNGIEQYIFNGSSYTVANAVYNNVFEQVYKTIELIGANNTDGDIIKRREA